MVYYKCFYKNGKIEGEHIRYYESGNISCKYYYKNGKLMGDILNIMMMEIIKKNVIIKIII